MQDESPAELQSALDEIVRRGAQATPVEMSAMATRFNAVCKNTQTKLDECYRLASGGLRSEAIFLADSHPPLIQSIEVIEGPVAQEFRTMLAARELPAPPATNMDRLGVVESAHAAFNKLEPLLSEYARMNLAGAPTGAKMRIVRKLMVADSTNSAWSDDLAALEIKRFREAREAITGTAPLNEAQLKVIVDDLRHPDNRSRPSPELVDRVVQRYDALRRKRFDATIATLTPLATAALSAHDVDQLDDLMREIDYHVQSDGFEIAPAPEGQLADARSWLSEQLRQRTRNRAFQRDCEALQQMLETPASADKLRSLRERVAGHGLAVPKDLSNRAAHVQSIADAYARRRKASIAALASIAVVCTLAATGMAIWYVTDRNARRTAIAAIESQLAADQLNGARDAILNAHHDHPRWFSDATLRADESRLATMQQDEADRATALLKRLAALEVLEDPDLQTPATLGERKALHGMTRTPAELDRLKLVEAKLDARIVERRIRADTTLEKIIDGMRPLLHTMKTAKAAPEIHTAIADYESLAASAAKIQFCSPEMTSQLVGFNSIRDQARVRASELLASEAKAIQLREDRMRQDKADEETLVSARSRLPDIPAYIQALTSAHAARPSVFADTAPLQLYTDLYLPAIDVNRHVVLAPADRLAELNLSAAAIRSTWGTIAQGAPLAQTPYADAILELRRRLAYADDFTAKTKVLREVLTTNFYRSANCVLVAPPNHAAKTLCYVYEKDTPVSDSSGVALDCFGEQNKVVHRRFLPGSVIEKIYPAPHSELMRRVEKALDIESTMRGTTSQLPVMIKDVLDSESANSYARRRLLVQLVGLNGVAGEPAPIPNAQSPLLSNLSNPNISISAPFKAEVSGNRDPQLIDLQNVLKQISTAVLNDEWNSQVTQRELKSRLLLAGLYLPLKVTGYLTVDKDSNRTVQPINAARPSEYWIVRASDAGPVFEIVALREKQGAVTLLQGAKALPDGLPLISPADGSTSVELLKECIGSQAPLSSTKLPACWPVNTLATLDQKGN